MGTLLPPTSCLLPPTMERRWQQRKRWSQHHKRFEHCNSHPVLKSSCGSLSSEYIASRDARITPRLKVSPTVAKQVIERFRNGATNVLVATSVIEEGFDVPEANVVISYDPLKNYVELCQRFGRARQQDSSIVVLDERKDRPMDLLESTRMQQDNLVASFKPGQNLTVDDEQEKKKQKDRERNAHAQMFPRNAPSVESAPGSATAALNLFAKKTKAGLEETSKALGGGSNNHECLCCLSYQSSTRSLQACARGSTKKRAKQLAAVDLLRMLQEQTSP